VRVIRESLPGIIPNHALYQAKLRPEFSVMLITNDGFSHLGNGITLNNIGMKIPRLMISAVLGSMTVTSHAQEATNTDIQTTRSEGKAQPAPTPEPSVPELSQIDQFFKQTSLGKEVDERRMHIEWRHLANRVKNDPEIVAAKKSAEAARTDLEKRQRLRVYYNIYYGKMRALASSAEMKTALDALKSEHLSYINQPRVRHWSDESLPTPTPEPRHKHKKK
jgi:hypothetical protein